MVIGNITETLIRESIVELPDHERARKKIKFQVALGFIIFIAVVSSIIAIRFERSRNKGLPYHSQAILSILKKPYGLNKKEKEYVHNMLSELRLELVRIEKEIDGSEKKVSIEENIARIEVEIDENEPQPITKSEIKETKTDIIEKKETESNRKIVNKIKLESKDKGPIIEFENDESELYEKVSVAEEKREKSLTKKRPRRIKSKRVRNISASNPSKTQRVRDINNSETQKVRNFHNTQTSGSINVNNNNNVLSPSVPPSNISKNEIRKVNANTNVNRNYSNTSNTHNNYKIKKKLTLKSEKTSIKKEPNVADISSMPSFTYN